LSPYLSIEILGRKKQESYVKFDRGFNEKEVKEDPSKLMTVSLFLQLWTKYVQLIQILLFAHSKKPRG